MVLTGLIKSLSSISSKQFNQHNRTTIVVSALIATTALATLIFKSYNQSDDKKLAPALTEEETKVILQAILEKTKLLASKMVNAANNIKQQIQAQGQDIDDEKVMKSFILPHFESGFNDIQSKVLSDYDVDDYELEEAVNEYISTDDKIKEASNRIKKLYQTCGGDVDIDEDGETTTSKRPTKDISLDLVVEMISVLNEVVSAKTDEYIIAFKAKYGIPSDQLTAEAFQQGIMTMSEEAEKLVTKKYDVTTKEFENALMKYSSRVELQQQYFMMQQMSQMKLQAHGMITPQMMMQ